MVRQCGPAVLTPLEELGRAIARPYPESGRKRRATRQGHMWFMTGFEQRLPTTISFAVKVRLHEVLGMQRLAHHDHSRLSQIRLLNLTGDRR